MEECAGNTPSRVQMMQATSATQRYAAYINIVKVLASTMATRALGNGRNITERFRRFGKGGAGCRGVGKSGASFTAVTKSVS